MDFRLSLVTCIRETQNAAAKATRELVSISSRYKLTPDGMAGEKQRVYGAVRETEEQARKRAADLLDARIAVLDTEEANAAAKRAADTDYLNRLHMKLQLVRGLQNQSDADLRIYFAEFANDPVAIEQIRSAIPGPRSVRIEPDNNNGKRQKHIEAVKKAVLQAIGRAGAYISPEDLNSGRIPFKEDVDALAAYIMAQNDDFSKNDFEVWESVVAKQPEYELSAKAWVMHFHN